MNRANIFIPLFVLTLSHTICQADDEPVGKFRKTDYGNWQAEGDAFKRGPAAGDLLKKLEIENAGEGPIASSEIGDDGPTGTLTSPDFKITKPYLSFRIGGGDYEMHACIDLIVDGKTIKRATGRNSDHLTPVSWDVKPWLGKQAQLRIIDKASGRWGHINVSQPVLTESPEAMPLEKGTLYQETLRPQFHFTARQWTMDRLNPGMRQEGWINDLNGMVYYDGEYHLFAQRWHKCWLHAVSKDLIHWEELEPAFWEENLDDGVQSGTCVIDYQNSSGLSPDKMTPPMVAFWTHADNHSHGISYSLDHGRTWKHYAKNPIMEFPERDPKVFWYAPGKHWVMMIYGSGKYHIFTSSNLLDWKNENNPINDAFECPDFFELPLVGNPSVKKWVLVHADGKYSLGTFDGKKYTEETPRYLSDIGGHNFYATQSFDNTDKADGRRIQLAWMRGSDFKDMPFSQQISFPCELTLHETKDGLRLFRQPIRELDKLQKNEKKLTDRTVKSGDTTPIATAGELFRIKAEVSIPDGAKLQFSLRGFPITLDSKSLDAGTGPHTSYTPVKSIEILVDRASVETFVNQGEISSTRYFQPKEEGVSMKAEGGDVTVYSMSIDELKSIWPEAARK
jgi:fructan beta-fructosidase